MELSIVVESSSRSDLGLSLDLDNVVVFVEASSPAERAGFAVGDQIKCWQDRQLLPGMRLGAVLTPASRHAFTVRRAPPRGAKPDDPSMVKWRGRSVEVRAGEAFEFPFEVPAGGCVVRYAYQVHDSLEIPFSLAQGGTRLHADNGGSCEGEVRVPGGGLCTVLFDNSSLFSFASRVVSYEVVLVPSEHLALQQRRRALHLAATGALAPLLAALGDGVGVIDAADEQGRTALHAAAAGGHAPIVEALLGRGASVDARSVRGATPLLDACAAGATAAARLLLDSGADAAAVDEDGRGALHLLARAGGDRARDAAAAAGVDLLLPNESSVYDAPTARHAPQALVAQVDRRGDTPLVALAAAGMVGCVTRLLDFGVPPDEARGPAHGRPLHEASANGHLGAVRLLLGRGASVAVAAPRDAGCALHAAAAGGHAEVLTALLDALNGGALNNGSGGAGSPLSSALLSTDAEWRSPLMVAAAGGHGAAVALLVAASAPLEQSDVRGSTALLHACTAGDPAAVQSLLRAGARPSHRNLRGRDALMCAAVGAHLPLLPLLLEPCRESVPDAMVHAAAAGHARTALALAELCPMPIAPPATGMNGKPVTPGGRRDGRSASAQLVHALWLRCQEETEAVASTRPPPDAPPAGSADVMVAFGATPAPPTTVTRTLDMDAAATRAAAATATAAAAVGAFGVGAAAAAARPPPPPTAAAARRRTRLRRRRSRTSRRPTCATRRS